MSETGHRSRVAFWAMAESRLEAVVKSSLGSLNESQRSEGSTSAMETLSS